MRRDLAIAWVVSVCSLSLRKSQARTLSILVAAAMHVQRVSMANIGRSMGGMVKHQIKRCWRFCSNERVQTADAMRPIVARLLRKRKKKLVVAVDWVDIKGFQTLVASIVLKGRSIPIAWASTTNHVYDGHRMTIEQLFRDDKSKRNGWSLRDTQITKPDRIDRMLLILAIAYLLLCGIGLIAKTLFQPAAWCSTNRDIECSIYTIGMIMIDKIRAGPQRQLAAVTELSEIAAPNWG